jgi:uncharacterized membrane protein
MREIHLKIHSLEQIRVEQLVVPVVVIALAALMRLLPHPPNVAPIAAMSLFGGMYVNKKYALIIPLLALFLSDFIIGFYKGMPFVYGSFLLIGLLGLWIRKQPSVKNIIAITLISSLLFFVITNFGVWFTGTIYPKTVAGLFKCYTAAIPFFRNTIIGDLLYVSTFVVGYKTILLLSTKLLPLTNR